MPGPAPAPPPATPPDEVRVAAVRVDEMRVDEVRGDAGLGATAAWFPPVAPAVLGRRFAPPATRWGAGHRGIDLVAGPGTVVVAPADGTVTFAGHVVDRDVVTVVHRDGLRTSLEPVRATVAVGTSLTAGAVVGEVTSGGHCATSCVHWGVRRGTEYLDPLTLLGGGPVVLLPLDG